MAVVATVRKQRAFQSAVAHELISNTARTTPTTAMRTGFKALSRMSSFPTVGVQPHVPVRTCFKALSRMSSFPTEGSNALQFCCRVFQSAVAHELISNERRSATAFLASTGFKALSRMSSFPTAGGGGGGGRGGGFKALSRMSSFPTSSGATSWTWRSAS